MTREKAIEYLNTLYMALAVFPNQQISLGNVGEMKESVSMAIKAVEQEPKWILVSEKLPEDGTYLVTLERIVGEPRIDIRSFAQDLSKVDEFDFPKQKWGWYDYDSEYGYWEDTRVIAWMPLPEPYKPQERNDKE